MMWEWLTQPSWNCSSAKWKEIFFPQSLVSLRSSSWSCTPCHEIVWGWRMREQKNKRERMEGCEWGRKERHLWISIFSSSLEVLFPAIQPEIQGFSQNFFCTSVLTSDLLISGWNGMAATGRKKNIANLLPVWSYIKTWCSLICLLLLLFLFPQSPQITVLCILSGFLWQDEVFLLCVIGNQTSLDGSSLRI